MKSNIKRLILLSMFICAFSLSSLGHSGRTDKHGGHYNRKTGEYHYHNSNGNNDNSGSVAGSVLLVFLVVVVIGIFVNSDNNNK